MCVGGPGGPQPGQVSTCPVVLSLPATASQLSGPERHVRWGWTTGAVPAARAFAQMIPPSTVMEGPASPSPLFVPQL